MGAPEIEAFLVYLAQERHVLPRQHTQCCAESGTERPALSLQKRLATRSRSASQSGSCRATEAPTYGAYSRRGSGSDQSDDREISTDGSPALWQRFTVNGVPTPARKRY